MGKFNTYKIYDDATAADLIREKIGQLVQEGKQILVLLSGGSAIPVEIAALKPFAGNQQICLSLLDERFGPVGHDDSNWTKLIAAGLEESGYKCRPVLSGKSRADTTADFVTFLDSSLNQFDYRLMICGLGVDGHTAGLLPGSPALSDTRLAADFDGPDYERITITPTYFSQVDEAFLYAVGQAKWPQLDRLETELEIGEQPAQALKNVKELTVLSDYKGLLL